MPNGVNNLTEREGSVTVRMMCVKTCGSIHTPPPMHKYLSNAPNLLPYSYIVIFISYLFSLFAFLLPSTHSPFAYLSNVPLHFKVTQDFSNNLTMTISGSLSEGAAELFHWPQRGSG